MMESCTKLEKVVYLLKSIIQVLSNIVMRKPALARCGKTLKQKVSSLYPCAAAIMPLRDALNTDLFSVCAEAYETKQSHNN